jgi:5-methylthioadenosine/S-adenosylhomocysteine deaminase
VQLLIRGGELITLDADRRTVRADLAVVGGRIAGIGSEVELRATFGEPDDVVEAAGRHVVPGFVNAHTHTFQSALRGLGDGFGLRDWQQRLTQPAYRHLSAEDAYWFTLLGCVENIRSGVTTIVNFQAFPNDLAACRLVAKAVGASGLRGLLVKSFYASGAPSELLSDRGQVMADVESVFAELHGTHHGRVRFCVGPPSTLRAPADWIQEAHGLAARHGSGIHMHIAEVPEDTEDALAQLGQTEISYLASLGVIDERFQAAHCVAITREDIDILARHGGNVVHNPVSNMYLASGVADVAAMLAAGVNVALGSDGPASNNNQDMFAVMKFAALLQRVHRHDPTILPPGATLELATYGGARATSVAGGSIGPGRLADLSVIDLSGVHNQPMHRPVSALVHTARPEDVESVVVDGRVVMRNRHITGLDEAEIVREVGERAHRLVRAAGLTSQLKTGWPWE